MKLTTTLTRRPAQLAILHLDGKLDGSNYTQLLDSALELHRSGIRRLLLDLAALTFLSSAGLAGMHQVALIFRGDALPPAEDGWAAFHAIDMERGLGTQSQVKLLAPSTPVRRVLELTGFHNLFEIYAELETALSSFPATLPAVEPVPALMQEARHS
jgi:anti-anti-sigma regulatory factor